MPGTITWINNPRTRMKKHRKSTRRSTRRASRKSYRKNPARRRSGNRVRRKGSRRFRRNPATLALGGGGILGGFKAILSKDNLILAGTATGAIIGHSYALGKAVQLTNEYRAKNGGGSGLPWYQNVWMRSGFKLALGGLTFLVARKAAPVVARGVVIGTGVSIGGDLAAEYLPRLTGSPASLEGYAAPPTIDLANSPDRIPIDLAASPAQVALESLSEAEATPWN
jgi:hypothetical protein